MGYSLESLGHTIRDLRRARGLTQAQLGDGAGYKKGAGVTISRIENGRLEPSPDRLDEIARTLGVASDELRSLAGLSTSNESLIATLLENFADAIDHASSQFLMKLRAVSARMSGIPPIELAQLEPGDVLKVDDTKTEVTFQLLFTRVGVEYALASLGEVTPPDKPDRATEDKTFIESVARGAVSLGAPALAGASAAAIRGLHMAMRIGAPTAPGARALDVAMSVAAIAGTAIGKIASAAARSRKQTAAIAAKSFDAAYGLSGAQPGLLAAKELIPRATEILEYIAVHAGHALSRWEAQLGTDRIDWLSLSDAERQHYREFVEVAAAHLAVADIWPQDLLLKRGADLALERARVDEILTQSERVVQMCV